VIDPIVSRKRPPARGPRYWPSAALLLPLLLVGAVAPGGGRADPEPSVPEQVLAELRAAHDARTQLTKERQDGAFEKERLLLLAAAVRSEAERLRSAAETARRDEADLKKRTDALNAVRGRLQNVEAMIDAVAERLEKALTALAARSLPGAVPPDMAAGITDPAKRLAAGARRLDDARRRATGATVELVVGTLARRTVTVRLLRAGAVAAWWMTLDGSQTGTAVVEDDRLALTPSETPDDDAAVRKAFAVAEGHAAPDWVLLRVRKDRTE